MYIEIDIAICMYMFRGEPHRINIDQNAIMMMVAVLVVVRGHHFMFFGRQFYYRSFPQIMLIRWPNDRSGGATSMPGVEYLINY